MKNKNDRHSLFFAMSLTFSQSEVVYIWYSPCPKSEEEGVAVERDPPLLRCTYSTLPRLYPKQAPPPPRFERGRMAGGVVYGLW